MKLIIQIVVALIIFAFIDKEFSWIYFRFRAKFPISFYKWGIKISVGSEHEKGYGYTIFKPYYFGTKPEDE